MMGRVFGRAGANEEITGALIELTERIEEQNAGLIATGTNVIDLTKMISELRKYNESMEMRIFRQNEMIVERMQEKFEEGIEKAVTGVIEAVKSKIKSLPNAKEVVKAIDTRTKEDRALRNYRIVKTRLERVMAKYLVNDLPLVVTRKGVKNPQMTPQGQAVYSAISKFIVDMAKASGKNKESYTSSRVYSRFFAHYGIKRYEREEVLKSDGKNMRTLLATIMLNGHVRQYIDYLMGVLESEKERVKRSER